MCNQEWGLKELNDDCKNEYYPCTNRNGNLHFKQIHKTQESLNKSLKKESTKSIVEPFESVADVVEEVINKDIERPSKYHKVYTSMKTGDSALLDVYDILKVSELPNAEIEHTLKKLIRNGSGDKSKLQDMKEAYVQLGMGIKRIK